MESSARPESALCSSPGEVSERSDDILVHGPLERNDQLRQAVHLLPAPFVEFRLVMVSTWMKDADLALVPL